MNLRDLARSIESKAKPGTVATPAAPAWTIQPSAPVALSDIADKREVYEAEQEKREAANESAYRGALTEVETLRRELMQARAQVDALKVERNGLALQVEHLGKARDAFQAEAHRNADERDAARRELAEARNDRKAEARTVVATDASAWHFDGPQGEGTADRIKAVGGVWRFHKRTERDQYRAAGFWLVPTSMDAGDLFRSLTDDGKRLRCAPL